MFLHGLIYSNRRFTRILCRSYFVGFGAANNPVVSDKSQDFRKADILRVPQVIKGFDKSDFFEVFSIHSKCQS